jgi:dTDP-glucose 4,6-dehydratase
MNLLVTGGAGFIGSHFVLRHKEQFPDDTIVVLDKLTYAGNKAFLEPVLNRIRFVQGDIIDVELVTQLIARYEIDTIVNFAAETHVDRSIKNAVPFLHTNILGVHSLIEVCKAHPQIKLLHVSTDEVFGDIPDGAPPCGVDAPLRPSSPYAASKASGEMLLLAAIRTYGINAAITRCTNNYGPHQADEKFIPTVVRNAIKNEPVPVYGKGLNKRDWLYVTDHTDGLEAVLAADWSARRLFNISADDERQNIDVAKMILRILGTSEDLIQFVSDRPGHDWRYALDSLSTRTLGWAPKVAFGDGLQKTVEWYKKRLA